MLDHLLAPRMGTGMAAVHSADECWDADIRELTATQLHLFRSHLLRLQGDCRRARFGNPTSDIFLQTYADRLDLANTRVFGCSTDGYVRGAVELRSLRPVWCAEAELAFSVEKPWRARGIGTALMVRAIAGARELGIDRLFLSCHAFNRPMQRIAERFAANMAFEDCECLADIAVHREPIAPILAQQSGSEGVLAMHL
jgi:GNAT superfamily N-acetyltransferase